MLVLVLSPVPMVRGFGVLLVVGVAIAVLCAFTAGAAALTVAHGSGGAAGADGTAPGGRTASPAMLGLARALGGGVRGAPPHARVSFSRPVT